MKEDSDYQLSGLIENPETWDELCSNRAAVMVALKERYDYTIEKLENILQNRHEKINKFFKVDYQEESVAINDKTELQKINFDYRYSFTATSCNELNKNKTQRDALAKLSRSIKDTIAKLLSMYIAAIPHIFIEKNNEIDALDQALNFFELSYPNLFSDNFFSPLQHSVHRVKRCFVYDGDMGNGKTTACLENTEYKKKLASDRTLMFSEPDVVIRFHDGVDYYGKTFHSLLPMFTFFHKMIHFIECKRNKCDVVYFDRGNLSLAAFQSLGDKNFDFDKTSESFYRLDALAYAALNYDYKYDDSNLSMEIKGEFFYRSAILIHDKKRMNIRDVRADVPNSLYATNNRRFEVCYWDLESYIIRQVFINWFCMYILDREQLHYAFRNRVEFLFKGDEERLLSVKLENEKAKLYKVNAERPENIKQMIDIYSSLISDIEELNYEDYNQDAIATLIALGRFFKYVATRSVVEMKFENILKSIDEYMIKKKSFNLVVADGSILEGKTTFLFKKTANDTEIDFREPNKEFISYCVGDKKALSKFIPLVAIQQVLEGMIEKNFLKGTVTIDRGFMSHATFDKSNQFLSKYNWTDFLSSLNANIATYKFYYFQYITNRMINIFDAPHIDFIRNYERTIFLNQTEMEDYYKSFRSNLKKTVEQYFVFTDKVVEDDDDIVCIEENCRPGDEIIIIGERDSDVIILD